jgi:hypothetical protein
MIAARFAQILNASPRAPSKVRVAARFRHEVGGVIVWPWSSPSNVATSPGTTG